jgi:hypothetical protein
MSLLILNQVAEWRNQKLGEREIKAWVLLSDMQQ